MGKLLLRVEQNFSFWENWVNWYPTLKEPKKEEELKIIYYKNEHFKHDLKEIILSTKLHTLGKKMQITKCFIDENQEWKTTLHQWTQMYLSYWLK